MKLRVALIVFLLVTSTSAFTAEAATNSTVNTACSSVIKKKVLSTITGQSEALRKQDFSKAISYATAEFRAGVSVKDFTQIINQSYKFLKKTKSFQILDCQQMGQFIHLGTLVTDTSNATYYLVYILQPQNKKELIAPNKTGYGIAAAQLGETKPQVSYSW